MLPLVYRYQRFFIFCHPDARRGVFPARIIIISIVLHYRQYGVLTFLLFDTLVYEDSSIHCIRIVNTGEFIILNLFYRK